MSTPSIRQILGSDIARWIQRNAKDKLSHRAQACAVNAVNFLVRAENIAEISTNVSYFCATHATEEAVASFISASKASRYTEAIGAINEVTRGFKAKPTEKVLR
ncbi:hypothetical protein [Sinorhizobium meliloti]|uniref:hypothetical protein n=1 Tax=Rhizobium meliloti TaxID=382 RepID=UPI000FDC6C49|nr:hypothetical protein [Sinorhizobium meliloti]RVM19648.1 hypothetical protein CN134_03095 [Sinorhizobium meliloti]RVO32486.1 hypothetical protein CN098_10455 [Sinorhizobium meliloti]